MKANKRCERLRFRSWHRGTKEMDLLLGSFADAYLPALTSAQLDVYEQILEVNDPDMYDWITGQKDIPTQHKSDVMQLIISHRYKG